MKKASENEKIVNDIIDILEQDESITGDQFFTGSVMMKIGEGRRSPGIQRITLQYAFALAIALLLMINIITIYQNYQSSKQEIAYRQEAVSQFSSQYFSN